MNFLSVPAFCAVVRGVSRSPRYVAEVYKFLGLEMPNETSGKVTP